MLRNKFYIKNYTFYSKIYAAKVKSLNKLCYDSKNQRKIWYVRRDVKLLPLLVDMVLAAYNGFKFVPIKIKHEMLGNKLGRFIFTRVRTRHRIIKVRKN